MTDEIDLSKMTADDFTIQDDDGAKADIVLPCILTGVDKKPLMTGTAYIAHLDVVMATDDLVTAFIRTDAQGGIIHLKCITGEETKR